MDWYAVAFLGAYHGINPGMGWLFAVALGMQQGSARGVWHALPPVALGHAGAVAVVVATAAVAGLIIPPDALRLAVASMLILLGLHKLSRHRHPRGGGMQVGFRDLTTWSFLMASAHGAGVMVLPFVMPMPGALSAGGHEHVHHLATAHTSVVAGAYGVAVGVHTLAYFAVMALTAFVVYRKLGLTVLRRAWLNVDWLWAGALVVTGVVVLLK